MLDPCKNEPPGSPGLRSDGAAGVPGTLPRRLPRLLLRLSPGLLCTGAALLGLVSCGAKDGAEVVPALEGPPLWRASLGARAGGRTGASLAVRAPCRLLLVWEEAEGERSVAALRSVAPGETVHVWWSAPEVTVRREAHAGVPPPEEATAGRSQSVTVRLQFGFEDAPVLMRSQTTWTRPGREQVLEGETPPPGRPEAFPFGEEAELLVVVVADAEGGRPVLVPHASGTRAILPPGDPEARATRVRLLLRIEQRSE